MKSGLITINWAVNILIVFEILFMISPFALYYYSGYSYILNILRDYEYTYWLTGFFLPHYKESSSWLFNAAGEIGDILFLIGLIMFLVSAGQIYYAKFTKTGAVTKGLYNFTRHPQYIAFAVMGLGVLLIWPRFLVLIGYVTMLFVYYLLAKKEEKDCSKRFGTAYDEYLKRTDGQSIINAVLFRDYLKGLVLIIYIIVLFLSVLTAFGIRNYSITTIPVHYTENSATVSTVKMNDAEMIHILELTHESPEVQKIIHDANNYYLNYIVPVEWRLADLPMESYNEGDEGHIQPDNISRTEFKILFTRALVHSRKNMIERDILKNTYTREPVVLVKVDIKSNKIISVEQPPDHVLWGDIPTPLF
jgi:protein-S-isoprenylcysteine O-methyltransferase Ste14